MAEAPPSLPVDLLLEVVARSDVATVVRFAATSKPLRLAMLDQDFRRRLALGAAPNGGFDPGLLLGVSYRLKDGGADRSVSVSSAPSRAANGHRPLPPGPVHGSLPAVIGRTVHWLSRLGRDPRTTAHDVIILSLHADTARATTIELPQGWARAAQPRDKGGLVLRRSSSISQPQACLHEIDTTSLLRAMKPYF